MDNYKLREITITNSLELKSFDDEKVKYYIGLQNPKVLEVLLNYIKTDLSEINRLSRFHQVLLVLMRMRSNLHNQYLAYRFGLNSSTVSRTFHNFHGDIIYKNASFVCVLARKETVKAKSF